MTVTLHLWMIAAFVVAVPVALEILHLACLALLARDLRK